MKPLKLLLLLATAFLISHQANAQKEKTKYLNHVLLMDWKEGTDSSLQMEVQEAFEALVEQIEGLESIQIRPATLANFEVDWVVIMRFSSEAALATYQAHPGHQAIKKLAGPQLGGLKKYDYWD